MVRLGIHYIEPRRVGFFVAEQALFAVVFALFAIAAARGLGIAAAPSRLILHACIAAGASWIALSLLDLHDIRVSLEDAQDGPRLLRVVGAISVLGAALLFVFAERDPITVAEATGIGAACLSLCATRSSLPSIGERIGLRTRVFLVGEGQIAHRLVREIGRDGGVEVVGFCGPHTSRISERAAAAGARAVVIATDERRGVSMDELLRCRTSGLEVQSAAIFAARVLHRLPVELVQPSDLIYGDGFVRPRWLRLAHRTLSVAGAVVILCLAAPLLAIAAIAIRRDSRGAILFRQERVGQDGRVFEMLKLRTMSVGAEATGATWARTADPRITRVGRWLRRFRIDELPQLLNVLRGDMDLVGPRPERPQFVAMLRRHIPYYDLRHVLAPGITGWAQVSYPYAASVEEAREKLQYDLYYVRHLGVLFDLYIMLLTARTIVLGKGAR